MADVMDAAINFMASPFSWGDSDCSAAVCSAFHRLYGIDPMRSVRGRYTTERGARRLIVSYGGMFAFAAALAAREGLVRCAPRPGAIGVNRTHLLLCVTPTLWLAKTRDGMTTTQAAETAYHVAG